MAFFFGYFIAKRKLRLRRTHTSRKRSKKLLEHPVSAPFTNRTCGGETTTTKEEDKDALASLCVEMIESSASSSKENGDDSAQKLHLQTLDQPLEKDEEQTLAMDIQVDVRRIEETEQNMEDVSAKETQKDEDPCLLLQLPVNMLAEILSRFPSFKEICLLRSVSKNISSITESLDFTSLRLGRADSEVFLRRDTLDNDSMTLFKLDLHNISSSVQQVVNCQYRAFLPKLEPVDMDLMTPNGSYDIVNSCNGFFCLRKPASLETLNPCVICNPVTREYTFIPEPEEKETYIPGYPVVSGFGCSAEGKDYKVVRLVVGASASVPYSLTAEIYQLGNNSWKTLGNVDNVQRCVRSPIFFNGVIHWLCNGLDGSVYILCFNVEAERFSSLRLPWNLSEQEMHRVEFGVLRGHLCVSRVVSWKGIEIWVMKNYGQDLSWREIFTVKFFYEASKVWKPLCWLENNDLVLMGGYRSLVFYNLETRTVREMEVRSGPMISTYKAFTFEPNFGLLKHIFAGDNIEIHNYGLESEEDIETVSLQRNKRYDQQWQYSLLSSSFYNME